MNGADTTDPRHSSWVSGANDPTTDFPIQNLPMSSFRRRGSAQLYRGGIAIGDQILDLAALDASHTLSGEAALAARAAARPLLNELMQRGAKSWDALRLAVFEGLLEGSPRRTSFESCLMAQADAEYALPAHIGDFTDFYSSIYHATTVGAFFRPDNPLLPNYKWVPIGYHGRSSSVGVSGQSFRRPRGQRLPAGEAHPVLAPSARLDYELELGIFMGNGNALGSALAVADAESHVFGLCLLNDWSARDIQGWEYQPLGPFLAKNFATTVSPWIVSLAALAPFRVPYARPPADPKPLDYLTSAMNDARGGIDIRLEAALVTEAMRERGEAPHRLSCTSFRHSYWTIAQLVAHHTVNGCNLRPGDLLGTGTQSGPTPAEAGSLLELTGGGKQPIRVGLRGEQRTFLEDGDTVIFRAWCEKPGAARIGFGEVRGRVLPTSAAAQT